MITVMGNIIEGAYTNGFKASENGMTIMIEQGSITFTHKKDSIDGEAYDIERYAFPSFSFDVEADPDFDTVYDVYLASDNSIEIEREVFYGEEPPNYTGEKELLHLLCTLRMSPNTKSLENVSVIIRPLERKEG